MAVTGVGQDLNKDDFLKLLVAQLRAQDPLEPVKDQEFIGQLAQFSTLESITALNASFGDLLKLQQLTAGADLIGRNISYATGTNGVTASAVVESLSVSNGSIQLKGTDGTSIALSNVLAVS